MLIKKSVLKMIGLCTAGVIVPTAVVGGYFLISRADVYRGFYTNPLNDSVSALANAYRGAVLQGAEVIMAPGFTHEAPIATSFAESPDFYKDIGFLFFDSKLQSSLRASANTWNITYRTDLGSIQVGIAAAYFLNYYQDVFLTNGTGDNSLTYAMWGGLPFSSVTSFMGGFVQGIEWANANLINKTINGNTYKEVFRLGDNRTPKVKYDDFTNGFGPSDGTNVMSKIIADRPDILMPVAGPQVWTANDLISLIGSKTILLGVDSAVEDDSRNPNIDFVAKDGKPIGNGKRVQFSSLKNLARSAETALKIINNGNVVPTDTADQARYQNFSANGLPGEIGGYGTIAVGDSANGNVGVSGEGINYLKEALIIANNAADPSLDTNLYNQLDKMQYVGYQGTYNYHSSDAFGLQIAFSENNTSGVPNLNTKGLIKFGDENAKNKFKIILSSANSILMDASFSQSCYVGLYMYLKSEGISIPPAIGGSE